MGITYLEGTVTGPSGESRPVEFLIDSGATYSVLPPEVWRAIGLEPKRSVRLRLADGSPMDRDVSECHIAIAGRESHTPVILGEPGDTALLGVVTLENLGLVFDPFRRELKPMKMLLA
jgi:clan AA aspartic protease